LATKDRFPLVRSDYRDRPGQPAAGIARDGTGVSLRILKAGILGATVAAIVFAIVLVENPLVLLGDAKLFTNAKAFLVALSAPQDGTREQTPVVQPTAGAQAFPPTASQALTDTDIAGPLKTAEQSQTENRQAATESLLGQFQAWAAGQDARADVRPVQPVQDAPTPPVQEAQAPPVQDAQPDPVQEARAEVQPVEKPRRVRHVKNVRAEIRARQNHRAQNHRAKVQRIENAQVQDRPPRDARAPEPPLQNARPPTFLESIGLRDY
jgi:hypothetical protein